MSIRTHNRQPSIKVIEFHAGPECPTCGTPSDLISIRGASPVYACNAHGPVPERPDPAPAYLAIASAAAEIGARVTIIAEWDGETYTEDVGTVSQVSSRTVFLRNDAGVWVRPVENIIEIRVATA